MSKGSRRVLEFVEEKGIDARIVTLGDSTQTSHLAAEALGCMVAEIAKSVVFLSGNSPVVVVISGDRRVDTKKLGAVVGAKVSNADAESVRLRTGYVIGGVPPFPHDSGVRVLLDRSLTRFDRVWSAAGTPHSVMSVAVPTLAETVGGGFVDVAS